MEEPLEQIALPLESIECEEQFISPMKLNNPITKMQSFCSSATARDSAVFSNMSSPDGILDFSPDVRNKIFDVSQANFEKT